MDNNDIKESQTEEEAQQLDSVRADHTQPEYTEKSRSGSVLATVAILLSLAALAASIYLYLTHNNQSQQLLSSVNRLEGTVQNSLTDLTNSQNRLQKNLERQNSELLSVKKSLAKMYSSIENTGETWSIEEIQHLLQLAVDQLSLAANIDGAQAALTIADRRVASSGDPELQALRQQIALDIASLQQVKRPDMAGTIHRLNALSESIDQLPVVHHRTAAEETDKPVNRTEESDSVWQKIGRDLSGLVKIRSIDQPVIPLLPPEQEYFLRENTKALLMTARLALLQKNKDAYNESLQQAKQWIIRYFNTESHNSQWAIGELVKLSAINPEPKLPDINGSLKQLQAMTRENQK